MWSDHEITNVRPRRRVLVVDDNSDLAWAIAMCFEKLGYLARTAFDGTSAVEIAAEFAPDLMLVDIAMPGMSGWNVARAVRRLALPKPPRMFAMSALDDDVHRARSRLVGFEAHLCKPLDLDRLSEIAR